MDDAVGQIVKALKDTRHFENSVIMFTSDVGMIYILFHFLIEINFRTGALVKQVPIVLWKEKNIPYLKEGLVVQLLFIPHW